MLKPRRGAAFTKQTNKQRSENRKLTLSYWDFYCNHVDFCKMARHSSGEGKTAVAGEIAE